jgi:hypothetical protein
MEEFFKIGKGDRLPSLKVAAFTRINGKKVPLPDLQPNSPVLFFLRKEGADDPPAIDGNPGFVEDAAQAILRYDWGNGETDDPGWYDAEFKVDIAGKTETVPNDDLNGGRKIKVWITEDVA